MILPQLQKLGTWYCFAGHQCFGWSYCSLFQKLKLQMSLRLKGQYEADWSHIKQIPICSWKLCNGVPQDPALGPLLFSWPTGLWEAKLISIFCGVIMNMWYCSEGLTVTAYTVKVNWTDKKCVQPYNPQAGSETLSFPLCSLWLQWKTCNLFCHHLFWIMPTWWWK